MEKNDIRKIIKEKRLYFDGGTGSVLFSLGMPAGKSPELLNIEEPETIIELHKKYIEAGANIIKTNTFGVNCAKFTNYDEIIEKAIECAKAACAGTDTYIAFDMGPTGQLLEPLGKLPFEEAVSLYANNVKIAEKLGVDLILIETMNDCLETKAAVLAAKENSSLPIFVTNAYDMTGKLMTGADPEAMVAMLEGLGVDAIGMNCSFGPDEMLKIIDKFTANMSVPLIVNPNAGLPQVEDGVTTYNIGPDEFADYMVKIAKMGGSILGGCCGTTPSHIKKMIQMTGDIPYIAPEEKNRTVISSYTHAVEFGSIPVLIGERINPTGKPKLKEALRTNNMDYIVNEGVRQADAKVHILDVNVGLPEVNEPETMVASIKALQAVTDLPLQIDSSDPETLGAAMRIYNGKPLVNSVNGKMHIMEAVFPLVKKYGGTVIALTIGEEGIPETAEGRVQIAKQILAKAETYGIKKKDIVVDPLAMAVSSDGKSAKVTLETVRRLTELGFKTSLGVSNISFGLPRREKINCTFFSMALSNGLSAAIMNPFMPGMLDTYYAFKTLGELDKGCADYIEYASGPLADIAAPKTNSDLPQKSQAASAQDAGKSDLTICIEKGLKSKALDDAKKLLDGGADPLSIISDHIIPALNTVGKLFGEQKLYLPQLLMSADSAITALDEIKSRFPKTSSDASKGFVLATVKGDVHDIGKNIVKVMLESYGFIVYDLGKDVPEEAVLNAVKEHNCKIVGLSALMTTTVPSMERTIELLHEYDNTIKVVVGGAVMNKEYADMIHADFYAKDAMDTVKFAQDYYKEN